jgi:hypothetical protein
MTEYQKNLLRILRSSAVEAATSPSYHAGMCSQWGSTPITRDWVVLRYGEAAAMAWDDIKAATKSFHREVERFLE